MQIRGQIVQGLALKIYNMAIALITSVMLARWLGPTNLGIYSFWISVASGIAIPAALGAHIYLIRETSANRRDDQKTLLKKIHGLANVYFGAIILIITLAAIEIQMDTKILVAVLCIFISTSFQAHARITEGYLQGTQRPIRGQLVERLVFPTLYICILAFSVTIEPLSVLSASLAYVVAGALSLLFFQFMGVKASFTRLTTLRIPNNDLVVAILRMSLVSALSFIMMQSDIVMLGLLRPPEDVGVYKVAVSIAALPVIFISPMTVILAPLIVRSFKTNRKYIQQRLLSRFVELSLLLAIPTTIIGTVYTDQVINILYGGSFIKASLPTQILIVSQLINLATGFPHLVLNMTGKETTVIRVISTAALVNISMNLILVPSLGPEGAAAATGSALLVTNIFLTIICIKKYRVNTSVLGIFSK